jgi:hypothetical protein
MKTLFKLVVALLVLNASARGAMAMWSHYQFKDATQQIVLLNQRATTDELRTAILAKATELNVPVQPVDIDVTSDSTRTVAEVNYTQTVQFFPNYPYPMKFSFIVDALSLGSLK